jgi:hypothetical protein
LETELESTPKKFFVFAEDGDCLQDMDVYRMQKEEPETRRAMVETSYLLSKHKERKVIKVAPVKVLKDNEVIEVMADLVTGTLYHKTGECLSSDRRRIIKWEK